MNRKRLARIAYTAAADRVLAARDAGTLTWAECRTKLDALRRAYEVRKEQIEFASFVSFHRIDRILGNMAREHEQGRVGNQHINREEAA